MRSKRIIHLLIVLLVFSLPTQVMGQTEALLWNGAHWRNFPQEIKIAYIKGVGNLADYEIAASGYRAGIISRSLGEEWRQKTITQIVQEVDRYYQENPRQLSTPVIEVVLRCCTALQIP
jgi:hypothetical protein